MHLCGQCPEYALARLRGTTVSRLDQMVEQGQRGHHARRSPGPLLTQLPGEPQTRGTGVSLPPTSRAQVAKADKAIRAE